MSCRRISSHRQPCTVGRHLPLSDLRRIGPPPVSTSFAPISSKQQEQQQNPTPLDLSLFVAADAAAHRHRLTDGRRHLFILLLPPSMRLRPSFFHRSMADSSTFSLSVSLFSSPALHTNIKTYTNSYIHQQSIAAVIPLLSQSLPPYSSKISLTLPFLLFPFCWADVAAHTTAIAAAASSLSLSLTSHTTTATTPTHRSSFLSQRLSLSLSPVSLPLSAHIVRTTATSHSGLTPSLR